MLGKYVVPDQHLDLVWNSLHFSLHDINVNVQPESNNNSIFSQYLIMIPRTHSYILIIGMLLLLFLFVFLVEERRRLLFSLLQSRTWQISMLLIIAWVVYIEAFQGTGLVKTSDDLARAREATTQGIMAFFIALCAHLDTTTAPFWFTWLVSYSLRDASH